MDSSHGTDAYKRKGRLRARKGCGSESASYPSSFPSWQSAPSHSPIVPQQTVTTNASAHFQNYQYQFSTACSLYEISWFSMSCPATIAGHPAYDGDSTHPRVLLPRALPVVVKLSPPPVGPTTPSNAHCPTPSIQPTTSAAAYPSPSALVSIVPWKSRHPDMTTNMSPNDQLYNGIGPASNSSYTHRPTQQIPSTIGNTHMAMSIPSGAHDYDKVQRLSIGCSTQTISSGAYSGPAFEQAIEEYIRTLRKRPKEKKKRKEYRVILHLPIKRHNDEITDFQVGDLVKVIEWIPLTNPGMNGPFVWVTVPRARTQGLLQSIAFSEVVAGSSCRCRDEPQCTCRYAKTSMDSQEEKDNAIRNWITANNAKSRMDNQEDKDNAIRNWIIGSNNEELAGSFSAPGELGGGTEGGDLRGDGDSETGYDEVSGDESAKNKYVNSC